MLIGKLMSGIIISDIATMGVENIPIGILLSAHVSSIIWWQGLHDRIPQFLLGEGT